MKKYKTIYAIINNKLEKLYVSHEDKFFNGEIDSVVLITALPNEKIPVNHFKNFDKKSPRLFIDKTAVLL